MSYRDCLTALKGEIGKETYADLEAAKGKYKTGTVPSRWASAAEDILDTLDGEYNEIVEAIQTQHPDLDLTVPAPVTRPRVATEAKIEEISQVTDDDLDAILDAIPTIVSEEAKKPAKQKKPKTEVTDKTKDEAFRQISYGKKKLSSRPVTELREMAKKVGIPSSQNKGALVEQLQAWYAQEELSKLPEPPAPGMVTFTVERYVSKDTTGRRVIIPRFAEAKDQFERNAIKRLKEQIGEIANYFGGTKLSKQIMLDEYGVEEIGKTDAGYHFLGRPEKNGGIEAFLEYVSQGKKPVLPTPEELRGLKTAREKAVNFQGEEEKTKAAMLKTAAEHGVEGVEKTMEALAKMFGNKNKLSSGIGFDPKDYEAAKPLFREAWTAYKKAGASLKEFFEAMIKDLGDSIRPLLKQFAIDMREEEAQKEPLADVPLSEGEKVVLTKEIDDFPPGSVGVITEITEDMDGTELIYAEFTRPDGETDEIAIFERSEIRRFGGKNVEPGSAGPEAAGAGTVNEEPRNQGADETGGSGTEQQVGPTGPQAVNEGVQPESDQGLSGDSTLTNDEQGGIDLLGQTGEFTPTGRPAGGRDSEGGLDTGPEGPRSVENGSKESEDFATAYTKKVKEQKALNLKTTPDDVVWGNMDSIEKTTILPFVEQQEDILFAEKRFFGANKRGVMFTNGTGTGKTFSGLGIAHRFYQKGYKNILLVGNNETVLKEWVKLGKDFGIDIELLKTKGAGKGMVGVTYKSLATNPDLVHRNWDLIIHDEVQNLSHGQEGKPTTFLNMSRALTGHPKGMLTYAQMMEPNLVARIDNLRAKLEEKNLSHVQQYKLEQEYQEVLKEWDAKRREHYANRERLWAGNGDSNTGRTFRVDLSATPFAHRFSIDLAEGFLFEYPNRSAGRYDQIDGRGVFLMEHFGYRIFNNRLTEPEAGVDIGLMERRFNTWLKSEKALSGRQLAIDYDYSREFIEIQNNIGSLIDQGFAYISDRSSEKGGLAEGYRMLADEIRKNFKYADKIKLLEAIKAPFAVARAKQHLALGRQVVIFHTWNVGGTVHPFKSLINESIVNGPYLAALADLQQNMPELFDFEINLKRPLDLFAESFKEDEVVFFNGDVSQTKRKNNKDVFNIDNNPARVIVVQEDAGGAGLSLHDTTGKHQRALLNIGLPVKPITSIQQEGRIYRVGNRTNAIFEYFTTGTAFENWTFAEKIASRADTVENLAHGEEARNLRNSFIDAYQLSSDQAPGLHQGLGGKEIDAAVWEAITEWEESISDYYTSQKINDRRDQREGDDYFATPEPLGLKMVQWADLKGGDAVLEPSAGHGAIARYFPVNTHRTLIDKSYSLLSKAAMRAQPDRSEVMVFEDLDVGANKFDAILMNPPYGSGGKTAIDHLQKAMHHLKNGGRIVAVLPEGPSADKKLDVLLNGKENELEDLRAQLRAKRKKGESVADIQKRMHELVNFYLVADIGLPRVTFTRAGTATKTHVIVLDYYNRPDLVPQSQGRSDIEAENINEFFDNIEDFSVVPRTDVGKSPDQILKDHGLTVDPVGNEFHVNGNTWDNRQIIGDVVRSIGGDWDKPTKQWWSPTDPTEKLARALQGEEWAEPEEKPLNWRPMWQTPEDQEWHSTHASINRVKNPITIGLVEKHYGGWKSGSVNADIGGGMHDNTIEYLRSQGVKNYIYDPFNRTPEYNSASVQNIKDGQADTATINNTLNVIKEPDIRNKVLREAANALKPGGTVYIQIYEGDGTGTGRHTRGDIWQENRKAEDFLEEVREVFPDAEIKYGLISAKNTIVAHRPAAQPVFSQPETTGVDRSIIEQKGLVITETTTKNGNAVWQVSGDTKPNKDLLKSLGAKWYGPKSVWSFYDGDPTDKIAEALSKLAYSRGSFGGISGKTVEDIRNELIKKIGFVALEKLESEGIIEIIQGEENLSTDDDLGGIRGAYSFAEKKAYLIADNIFDNAYGVLLHEVGVHYGMAEILGPELYAKVIRQIKLAERAGNKAVQAARAKVPATTAKHLIYEEVFGHLVEDPKNHKMGFIRQAIVAIRKFLRNLGFNIKVSDDEFAKALVDISKGMVDSAAAKENWQFLRGPNADLIPRYNEHSSVINTQRFKDWFNGSKIVDKNGYPMTVYHGSPNGTIFYFDSNVGKDLGGGAKEGFYFSPDPGYASAYSSNKSWVRDPEILANESPTVYPVWLSIQNPLVLNDQTFWDGVKGKLGLIEKKNINKGFTDSAYLTAERIQELRDQGYDGIINYAADEIIAFGANQIKSIFNDGAFSKDNAAIRHSRSEIFHSSMIGKASKFLYPKASAKIYIKQFKKWIANGSMSDKEYSWIGVEQWLNEFGDQVLTKQDVLDYLYENRIIIEDNVIDPAPDKFSKYSMPGYRNDQIDITLNLKPKAGDTIADIFETPESHKYGKKETDYNRLLHLRMSERVDFDGKRVLFIDELQSDWMAQAKRDDGAFISDEPYEVVHRDDPTNVLHTFKNFGEAQQKADELGAGYFYRFNEDIVPDVPFKTNWEAIGIKRAIRYAAENGYDRLAWHGDPMTLYMTEGWGKVDYRNGRYYINGGKNDVTSIVNRYLTRMVNAIDGYANKFNSGVGETVLDIDSDVTGQRRYEIKTQAAYPLGEEFVVIHPVTDDVLHDPFKTIEEAEAWADAYMGKETTVNAVDISDEMRKNSLAGFAFSRTDTNRDPALQVSDPDTTPMGLFGRLSVEMQERFSNAPRVLNNFWRRWFAKEGLLGDVGFQEWFKTTAEKKLGQEEGDHIIYDFEKAIKKAYRVSSYKMLPQRHMEEINKFLQGDNEANVDQSLIVDADGNPGPLAVMRSYLDNQSRYIYGAIRDLINIKVDELSEDKKADFFLYLNTNGEQGKIPENIANSMVLLDTIMNNMGEYLHRSYQAFDDAKWEEKVFKNEDLLNRARAYILEKNPELNDAQVDGAISAILVAAAEKHDFINLVSSGIKFGTKDISILRKKKKLDPVIRELLGEYKDPRLNWVRSVEKMQWYIANHHFLMNLRQRGLGLFLFKEPIKEPGRKFSKKIAPPNSPKLNPLDGLYTSEEFDLGLRDVLDQYQGTELMRYMIQMNGLIKYGKTVLSPTTQWRNLASASFFAVLNGHFGRDMFTQLKKAFGAAKADLWTHDREFRNYLNKLTGLGVLHNNPRSEEYRLALRDAIGDIRKLDRYTAGAKEGIAGFLDFWQRMYQVGDDFWKIYGFEMEKASWLEMGMSESQAEKRAVDRIVNGYPTYTMVPKFIRALRRNLIFGAFVSFPWEIMRTVKNQGRFMAEDFAAGRKKVMAKRMIGWATAGAGAYTASVISMMVMGMDGDDDEAVRAQLPEWSRNSQLVYLGYDEDGLPVYWDASHLDPYTYLKKPITALLNGNNHGIYEKIKDAAMEAWDPFVGFDIASGALLDVWDNKKGSGGPIYKEKDQDKGWLIFDYLRKAVQPGGMSNIERTAKAITGDVSRSGREYKIEDELRAWIGIRTGTLNLKTSMKYKGIGFNVNKSEAGNLLSWKMGTRETLSDDDVKRAVSNTLSAWEEAYRDFSRIIDGSRRLGMSDAEIRKVLKSVGISTKDRNYLMRGEIPHLKITSNFIKRAGEQAKVEAKNYAELVRVKREILGRRQLVRDLLKQYYAEGEL